MDNVLIVIDDLDAVIAFFVELGMELEGRGPIEGRWVERVIGIDEVRQYVAMLRTPDGHGRIELAVFHTPKAISVELTDAPANTLGIRRIMFAVDDIDDVVARLRSGRPRASRRVNLPLRGSRQLVSRTCRQATEGTRSPAGPGTHGSPVRTVPVTAI